MKRYIVAGVLVGVVVAGSTASLVAQEEPTPVQEGTKMLQGEVIDPALYLREGRHGPEVEELIYDGVDAGQTLALLEDETQAVYLFLAGEPGADPNELLYEHVGRRVTATGSVYERGGLKGIVVTAIEPIESTAESTATQAPPSEVGPSVE